MVTHDIRPDEAWKFTPAQQSKLADRHRDWAGLCEPVARIVWGKPTRETPKELRWGTHGVAAMNFQALTDLAGGRLGVIDTVCPALQPPAPSPEPAQARPAPMGRYRRNHLLLRPLWRQGLRPGRQSEQAPRS